MKKLALLLVFALLFTSVLCSCSPKKPVFDNKAATDAYREYVKSLKIDEDSTAYYNILDIDGDSSLELLISVPGTLSAYTYKADEQEKIQKIGEVDHQVYRSDYRAKDTEKYPGLFVRTYEYEYAPNNYNGTNAHSYITVKDGKLVKEKLWDDKVTTKNGEAKVDAVYHVDSELVNDAKKVFEDKNTIRWYTPGFMESYSHKYVQPDYTKDEEYNFRLMLYGKNIDKHFFADAAAIYDVNADGEPDLITYHKDDFAIYTIVDDAVKRMYAATCDRKLGAVSVLKNGDVLTEYNNGIQNYIYDDLGSEFETISSTSFSFSETDGETEYTFAGEGVSKTDWDKKTEKYLKAEKVKLKWSPQMYAEWEKYIPDGSDAGRDIGPFFNETDEIIKLEGKYYQSYVFGKGARYVLVNYDEYKINQEWDWVSVGTQDEYSLDLIREAKK